MFRTAFPTISQRIARRHAEEEIERFDREVRRADLALRATLSAAMAATGTEGERRCALDHLDSLLRDTFGGERKKLLNRLDDDGGDVSRYPWPIQDDEDQPAVVIPFPA